MICLESGVYIYVNIYINLLPKAEKAIVASLYTVDKIITSFLIFLDIRISTELGLFL